MKTLSVFLLTFALVFESALTTLPLILLVLLNLSAIFRSNFIFVLAFIFGIILDLLALRTIGLSSIFFIIFIFLILLYQSKFEIATNTFIIFASFIGSGLYLFMINNTSNLILESVIAAALGFVIFVGLKRILPYRKK